MFTYIFTYLVKLSRHSNKSEELTKEMYELMFDEEDKMAECPYTIKGKMKDTTTMNE